MNKKKTNWTLKKAIRVCKAILRKILKRKYKMNKKETKWTLKKAIRVCKAMWKDLVEKQKLNTVDADDKYYWLQKHNIEEISFNCPLCGYQVEKHGDISPIEVGGCKHCPIKKIVERIGINNKSTFYCQQNGFSWNEEPILFYYAVVKNL